MPGVVTWVKKDAALGLSGKDLDTIHAHYKYKGYIKPTSWMISLDLMVQSETEEAEKQSPADPDGWLERRSLIVCVPDLYRTLLKTCEKPARTINVWLDGRSTEGLEWRGLIDGRHFSSMTTEAGVPVVLTPGAIGWVVEGDGFLLPLDLLYYGSMESADGEWLLRNSCVCCAEEEEEEEETLTASQEETLTESQDYSPGTPQRSSTPISQRQLEMVEEEDEAGAAVRQLLAAERQDEEDFSLYAH